MTTFTAPGPAASFTGNRPSSRGDDYASPIMLLAASGSVELFFWGAGPEAGEPDVGTMDESIWLDFLGDVPGTLTLSSDVTCLVDVGAGADMDSWSVQSSGDPHASPLGTVLGAGSPARLRVRPNVMVEKLTLTWTYVELIPPLIVNVLSDLVMAPGTFRITITNGDPLATVTVTTEFGDDIPDFDLDDQGSAISLSIPVDDPHDAGTYTLTVSHPGRDDVSASFVILVDPLLDPIGQPADALPVGAPPNEAGVQKWVLQDPAPGGESYTFEINPDSATSPHGDNVFTDDATVAPNGQYLTWEGGRRAVQWNFKGTLLTQTQYEALARFAKLNRRVYLIDNRLRAWVVSVDGFDPTFKQTLEYPWFHTYTVSATIFAGPLEAVIPG